jgi:hypothetical protein
LHSVQRRPTRAPCASHVPGHNLGLGRDSRRPHGPNAGPVDLGHQIRSDGPASFSEGQNRSLPAASPNPNSFASLLFSLSCREQRRRHGRLEVAPGGEMVVLPEPHATPTARLSPLSSLPSASTARTRRALDGAEGHGATVAPLAGARVRPEPRAVPSSGTKVVPFGPSPRRRSRSPGSASSSRWRWWVPAMSFPHGGGGCRR